MYTLIISIGMIGSIIILYLRYAKPSFFSDHFDPYMYLMATVVVAAMGIDSYVNSILPTKQEAHGCWNLVAMRSADSVNGEFIWRTASANGKLFYHVFVKNTDGSLSPHDVPADENSRITEDDSLHNEGKWCKVWIVKDYSSSLAKWTIVTGLNVELNLFTFPTGSEVQKFSKDNQSSP